MVGQVTINLSMRDERVICAVPGRIGYQGDNDRTCAVHLDLAKSTPARREWWPAVSVPSPVPV